VVIRGHPDRGWMRTMPPAL